MVAKPNLYTIGPHKPFLVQLAQSWLRGELNVGPVDDPLNQLDTVFYLPTRRAARAFADVLTAQMGGRALLPRIRTLADADDDEFLLPEGVPSDRLAIPEELWETPILETMPALRRQLILTRLVDAAGASMRQAQQATDTPTHTVFPQSVAEAAYLARTLAQLLDQVETEECDWQRLALLIPDDHAAYWQLTLTLLTLVTDNWPTILKEAGLVDPSNRRRLVLDARTARLSSGLVAGPVIAAGSTGSIPATARLLKAISYADQGAVVLPGLDLAMPNEAFGQLLTETPEAASHPQHGLANLLTTLQAKRQDVVDLTPTAPQRASIISAALLPAAHTARWPDQRPESTSAFDDVDLLEASTEAEEGLALAMILQAAAVSGQSAALVTPDRNLARRVQLEAQRFGLELDDSAGTPLRETPQARLLLLAAEAWESNFAAIPLLALLKHPLTLLGQDAPDTRSDTRLLERLALRGLALQPGLRPLREVIDQRALERDVPSFRQPAIRKSLGANEDKRVVALIDRLETAFQPLADRGRGEQDLASYGEALFTTCETLCAGADREAPNLLFGGPGGEALATFRLEMRDAASVGLQHALADARPMLEALLGDRAVRPARQAHPHLHIWGPLEARLQHVDHMILAGLNETSWPILPSANPLLSRGMMAGLAMAAPERRIGLSAHDIEQALGHPKVTLTRALKVDGAPTVASRWLQRLLAYLPEAAGKAMKQRGGCILAAAESWDTPTKVLPRSRPEPRPEDPPTQLSITDVETLIRDPYTVYARRVLRLEEAPDIGLPPGPSERGTLFHALFEAVADGLNTRPPDEWTALFEAEAKRQLATLAPFPDIQALWAERIARIIPKMVEYEQEWSHGLTRRVPEVSGRLELSVADRACRLTGRADRIDIYNHGAASILDFKTGAAPTKKQILTFAPQLPLTAAMLAHGAFAEVPSLPSQALLYVRAGGNRDPVSVDGLDDLADIASLPNDALEQLQRLWATFLAGAPFTPLLRPFRARDQGSYHLLARVKEWRAADEQGSDAP